MKLVQKPRSGMSSISELDPLTDPRWRSFLQRHRNSSVFHSVGWLQALARTYGYKPIVLTSSRANVELDNGLLFCRVQSWLTGNRIVSLPFSDHCAPLCHADEDFEWLVSELASANPTGKWKYIELRRTDDFSRNKAEQMGFKPLANYTLHKIDLSTTVQEIFSTLDKNSLQRRIRRAERAKVKAVWESSQLRLRDFYELMVRTRARHCLPPQPYKWFKNVLECMGNDAELGVLYVEKTPVAAVLVLHFKDVTYFKYGCSDARYHGLGTMPYLLWQAVVKAKLRGSSFFDLGRTGSDEHGLLIFKNRWTQLRQTLTYWVSSTRERSFASSKDSELVLIKRVCSFLPQRLLAVAGAMIYRHVG